MSEQDIVILKKIAAALIKKTEPLLDERGLSRERRRFFRISSMIAAHVLDDDLKSTAARRRYRDFRLILDGTMMAEAKVPKKDPNLEYVRCMLGCMQAYNECMGRTPSGNDFDIPDDDTPEGDPPAVDPDKAACFLSYASCLASCNAPPLLG